MNSSPHRYWRALATALLCLGVAVWMVLAAQPAVPAAAQEGSQDHSTFSTLAGPFETPQQVTDACLECHYTAADEVMSTIHWTWEMTDPITGQELGKQHVINNYCIAVPSNEPRCTSCHVGFGYTSPDFFETATESDVDCLVCHDGSGTYKKFPAGAGNPVLGEPREFPAGSGKIWQPVDLVAVAQSVGAPTRANCGSCHFFGGGGDAVKHGDLDATLLTPDRDLDVHMAADGLDFSCATCHAGDEHEILGRVYNGEERVLCESCHSGDNTPHQALERGATLNRHTETIACQTCHIPAFARGQATKMSWDWSTAGRKDAEGKNIVEVNDKGQVTYDTMKGTFTWGSDVTPEYHWWNGEVFYLTAADTIDPDGVLTLTDYQGSLGDGKITPFKRFTGTQPYDAGNNTLVIPNLFPNNAEDTDAYWRAYDWQAAVSSGMAVAGYPYSGELGWVDTEFFWVQNHMVAPSEDALDCAGCHTLDGRLDFEALGYTPERAAFLSTLEEPAAQRSDTPMSHENLTSLAGPFETPQAVTATCLECHTDAAEQVMGTIHWTWEMTDPITGQELGKQHVINNYCIAVPSNEPRCTSCHVGYGYTDAGFFARATEEDVDCLVCHAETEIYKKFPAGAGNPVLGEAKEFPGGSGTMWEPVDLAAAARSVGTTERENCGSCHFFGGGGDAVKHGDLDSTLLEPDRDLDVHMASGGLDFSCATCHAGGDHEIEGRVYNGEERVLCVDCHSGSDAPHAESPMAEMLTRHTENIACQTCHIPAFARGQATKLSWDWSTAGRKNAEGMPYKEKDADGNVVFDSQKGTFTWGINVVPDYAWWNGEVFYLTAADTIDPSGVLTLTDYQGSRGDGKITPFKRFTGTQPYDAGNNTLVVPNLFPNNADDTDAYWKGWDWDAAVSSGMAVAGYEYSGELGWVDTEFLWTQNHMVAPADDALRCADCHTRDKGRLDFLALGYTEERAADLVRTLAADVDIAEQPYAPQSDAYRIEERAYVGGLQEAISERRADLNLALGIIIGVVVALVLAVVAAVLVLRSRGVSTQDARAWLRENRRGVTAIVILIVGSALIGFVSLHYLLTFTASTEFCGELCHATNAEYVTYHTSLHANVGCVECHVGEGLDNEFQAKLNGLRELYLYATNTWERPIPSPVETLRPAREVCETCHWPEVFYADRALEIPHFANDEDNSRTNTYMVVKIGGGTERAGQGQGIHWHIENKVEYIATDPQRQIIPWVRAEIGGQTITYTDVTNPMTEEELAQYEIREMDCIDCHNRASHIFRSTDEMLDEALANGVLPTDLPYLRREAEAALGSSRDDVDVAMAAIEALPEFYAANYPEIYEARQDVLVDVVQELKDMYSISHFPTEQVFADTYPDNAGHLEDPGCFRCHNGKHYAQDDGDQSIRLHCQICHTIPLTVDAGDPVPDVPFQTAPQPASHLASTWVADHRYTFDETCVDCHEEETFCANENCHGRSWPYVNLEVSNPPFPLP